MRERPARARKRSSARSRAGQAARREGDGPPGAGAEDACAACAARLCEEGDPGRPTSRDGARRLTPNRGSEDRVSSQGPFGSRGRGSRGARPAVHHVHVVVVVLFALLLVLAVRQGSATARSRSASDPPHQQEINLKLRFLVPRDHRGHQASPASPAMSITSIRPTYSSQQSVHASGSAALLGALPPSLPAAMQPVSLVSSLAAVASSGLAARYRKPVPIRTSFSVLRPALTAVRYAPAPPPALAAVRYAPAPPSAFAWSARPGAALLLGAPLPPLPVPAPHQTRATSPAAPRPELINITLIRGGKGRAAKPCNCSEEYDDKATTTTPTPPPPPPKHPTLIEEDEDEDVENVPPASQHRQRPPTTPIPPAWAGYIPPDVLEHAKKVLTNDAKGRVKLTQDKVHFRQNFKQPNYPRKPVPGVGEDLWSSLKDDLADLVKTTEDEMKDVDMDDDALHHRDPDFKEPMADFEEDADGQFDNLNDPNTNQPYFTDFWGNRVPQYENGFHDETETAEDSRKEYNNDPNGWDPDYTRGLWSGNDGHLQEYSGFVGEKAQSQAHGVRAPYRAQANNVRPMYDNGLGIEANYNKYVLDNGTWVAPDPDSAPEDDLRGLMQDAVSHEPALQNPSDHYPSYEDVVNFLNSRYRSSAQYRRPRLPPPRPRARSRSRLRPSPPAPPPPPARSPRPHASRMYPYQYPPSPLPFPLPLPPPPPQRRRPLPRPQYSNPNLVDVNQLVEALILHKEKERAMQQQAAETQDVVVDDNEGDDEDDDEDTPVRPSNGHGRPPATAPSSMCKGVKDVGLTTNGQAMSHLQGVVCATTFDHSEDDDE